MASATRITCLLLLLAGCAPPSVLPETRPVSELTGARARAHREQGIRLLVDEGRVPRAAAAFAEAVRLQPDDASGRLWAAWTAGLLADEQGAFDHLLWVIRSGVPEAELATWAAYRLFATREQGVRLRRVLEDLVERSDTSPTVRARALHFLGHTLRYLGKFDQASRAFDRLGHLRDWMVVGPFDNDQNTGFDTVYPPEQGFTSYEGSYPGKLRPVRWRRVRHFDFDGRVNLAALLDPSRWSCAYLVTFVHAERARDAALRVGAYRGVKVWLNDRLLLSDDEAHLAALDQYVVGARLETGWNRLLVKVCQRTGPWQLRLRMTDLEGRMLSGVHTSVDIHRTPDRTGDRTPLPAPATFEKHLEKAGNDVGARFTRALWSRRTGFYRRAVEEAVGLAEAYPRSPLVQMLLARAHFAADHEGSALKTIRGAEELSPGLPDAVLERTRYEKRHSRTHRALKALAPLRDTRPDSVAVRTLYISLLSDRGWTYDALKEANELRAERPDHAWLLRTIATLHFHLDQQADGLEALRQAMAARANQESTYSRLVDKALARGEVSRALHWIRRKSRVFPCLITSALREVEILLSSRQYAAALAVCDRVARIAPQYWYLQKLRGDVLYRLGDREGALAGYQASLELHPDNAKLRDYVDFLVQHRDEVFERYGLAEAAVEEILTNPPPHAAYPQADAVFLLDDHVTHLFQDGSASHLVRQIYFIRTEAGQRRFNHFRVPRGSSFRLEAAETIKADGSRQEATSIHRGVIHFPSVEPGSLVHLAYRYKESSSSWMEDHFAMDFAYQGSVPWLRGRWVLVTPADKELSVLRRGDMVSEHIEEFQGKKVYVWTGENAPMLHRESMRPPVRLLRAAVFVTTVPSWEVLARWQNSLISDQFEVDQEIRNKTQEITRDARTPMDKLQAIYEFVAREVRYLNHDVGIFGKKPNKAINIFGNRFGDCKDKATLMIAMLKEVGIQAAYAGVRTVDRGPVFWEVPYAQTNHIITFIPAQAGIDAALFVDGTSRFGDLRYLPDRDQGLKALVLDGEGHSILETPMLPPETSTLACRMRAELTSENTLRVSADERWTGWFAYSHRRQLNVEGKRGEELAKELGYRFPGAVLTGSSFSGLDDLGVEAGSRYTLRIPGRARKEGGQLRIQLMWPSNLGRNLARQPERHYDIFMIRRTNIELTSTLAVPAGMSVRALPAPLEVDHPFLRFALQCTQDEGQVTCTRTLTFKSRTLSRADYPAFRKLCGRIDQAEAQEIVLAPRG